MQYADDLQVAVCGGMGDIDSLVQHMEHNLALLSRWFGKNGIKINAQKTQATILGSRQNIQRLPPVNIKFMDADVAGSPTVVNLGVTFDQNMTFTHHLDSVVRRCTGMLCRLSHSRHSLPQSTLLTLILVWSSPASCTVWRCTGVQRHPDEAYSEAVELRRPCFIWTEEI